MNRILLVEDDPILQESLGENLKREGFEVIAASSLEEGGKALEKEPDLVILDWMLPDGQGIELIKSGKLASTPVIMLTARTDVIDKVLGLELGASDYMTKPFEPRELIARIRVQLRNAEKLKKLEQEPVSAPAAVLEHSAIRMDLTSMQVTFHGLQVNLTKMEYTLLKLLLENPGKVFSRDEILDMVWGMKYPTTRTVDMHICQLRQKFESSLFETVHGMGYRFRPAN
jgi:DNA-binding response OmpR family regulator